MMQRLEDLDLSQCSHWHALLLVVHENALERHRIASGFVHSFVHLTGKMRRARSVSRSTVVGVKDYVPKSPFAQLRDHIVIALHATALEDTPVDSTFLFACALHGHPSRTMRNHFHLSAIASLASTAI